MTTGCIKHGCVVLFSVFVFVLLHILSPFPSALHTHCQASFSLLLSRCSLAIAISLCVPPTPTNGTTLLIHRNTQTHTHRHTGSGLFPAKQAKKKDQRKTAAGTHKHTELVDGRKNGQTPCVTHFWRFHATVRTRTHTHTGYTGVVAGQQQQHCSQTGPNPTPQQQAPEQQHHHQRALCKIRNKNTHKKKNTRSSEAPAYLKASGVKNILFSKLYSAVLWKSMPAMWFAAFARANLLRWTSHVLFSPFCSAVRGYFFVFFFASLNARRKCSVSKRARTSSRQRRRTLNVWTKWTVRVCANEFRLHSRLRGFAEREKERAES